MPYYLHNICRDLHLTLRDWSDSVASAMSNAEFTAPLGFTYLALMPTSSNICAAYGFRDV